jgi:acetyl-CoA acyltransferase
MTTSTATYVIYAQRTAIGAFGGQLSGVRVDDLLAHLLKDFKAKATFSLEEIDDVVVGCANQAGEDNRNLARMSALLAGFPMSVPGTTINRLCGSSLDALIDAHAKIQSGLMDCVVVGGAESMSRAPYVLSKAQNAFDRAQTLFDTALGWRFPNSLMEKMFPLFTMGETAEEVQKETAISREDQDTWAYRSHQRALASRAQHAEEIIPLTITQKKQMSTVFTDEGPRSDTTLEKLAQLKPAFRAGGTVTAGNASSLNDGAAVLVVCSDAFLKRHGLKPFARVEMGAVAGLHPNVMGLGPIYAIEKLLKKTGKKISDYQRFELNEAFAVQVLATIKRLSLPEEQVNIHGGAIALGHPLGCSGARLAVTLMHQFKRERNCKRAIASMCIGVGQGIAVSFENTN